MNNQEYDQHKRECWEEFCKEYPHPNADMGFNYAFDRAYALGKLQASCKQVKETITQEDIEKVAIEYVLTRQQARHNAKKEEDATMRDFDKTIKAWDAYDMEQAFESGANLFLGKQEKKADSFKIGDNVRVKETNQIGTIIIEPYSNDVGYRVYFDDGDGGWDNEYQEDELIPYTEPKPAEPKFKLSDRVRIKDGYYKEELHNCIGIVRKIDGCHIYVEIDSTIYPATIHSIESYTEPKNEYFERLHAESVQESRIASEESHLRNLSQETANCDKCPKSVQKTHPDFGHSRLHIAAMAMQGMLSNTTRFSSYEISDLVRISLNCADALIAEAALHT